MKLYEALQHIREQLEPLYGKGEASAMAAMIVEHHTGFGREASAANQQTSLDAATEADLEASLEKLLRHEPIQYIMNKAWFYGMELYVDHRVLIPRPETEELAHWIVNDLRSMGASVFRREATEADHTTSLKIVDIGTGSGCIALAIKKQMPAAEVWGFDKSEEALNVARRNGAALDIRVDFQGIDFLDEAQRKHVPVCDILVSNPPYIPASEQQGMAANVVAHEPHLALFVPDEDPLVFYQAIAAFAAQNLRRPGAVYVEMHEDLGSAVEALFRSSGYTDIVLKKDMQGKERMLRVRLT